MNRTAVGLTRPSRLRRPRIDRGAVAAFFADVRAWMAGSSPAMTTERVVQLQKQQRALGTEGAIGDRAYRKCRRARLAIAPTSPPAPAARSNRGDGAGEDVGQGRLAIGLREFCALHRLPDGHTA